MTDKKVKKLLLSECEDVVESNKEKMLSACGVKREKKSESRVVPALSGVLAAALIVAVVTACIVPTLNNPVAAPVTDTDAADDTAPVTGAETTEEVTIPADEKDVFGDVKFIDGRQTRKIEERKMTVSRLKYTVSAEYSGIADELYEKYGVKLYVSYDDPDNPLTIIVQEGKRAERCYSELLNGTPLCFVWADKTPLGSPALLYVCTEVIDVADLGRYDYTPECHSTFFVYYPDTGTFAAEIPLERYRRDLNNYGESIYYEIPLYNALLTDGSQVRLDENTGILYLDLLNVSHSDSLEPQTIYMINYYDDTDGVRRINCHGLMSPLYFLLDINGTYNIVYPDEIYDILEDVVERVFPKYQNIWYRYQNKRYDNGGDLRLLYDCDQVSELTLSLYAANTGKAFTDVTEIDTNGRINCEDLTAIIKETLKKYPVGDYEFNLKFKLKNGLVLNYPVMLRQVEPGVDMSTDFAGEKITVSSGGARINVSASTLQWISYEKKNESENENIIYSGDFDITLPDGYELVEITVGPSANDTRVRSADLKNAIFNISFLSPRSYVVNVTTKTKIEGIAATVTFDFVIIKEKLENIPVEYLTVRSNENEIKVQGVVIPYEIDESLLDPTRVTLTYGGKLEYFYSDGLVLDVVYVLYGGDLIGEYRSLNDLNSAFEGFENGTYAVLFNTAHSSGEYGAAFYFSIEK